MKSVRRGEIYLADLRNIMGSEQGGIRPVLIVQNDKGNYYSPTTIVVAITSKDKAELPTHVVIQKSKDNGLNYDSTAEAEQIITIDKRRIKRKLGQVDDNDLQQVAQAMRVSMVL